jgi:hypothetical protein
MRAHCETENQVWATLDCFNTFVTNRDVAAVLTLFASEDDVLMVQSAAGEVAVKGSGSFGPD